MPKQIRLSGIIKESIVDGPGIRYVIFFQGCKLNCFMCHNPETISLDGGYLECLDKIVSEFKKDPLIQGITLSGGEPFLQKDAALYLVNKAIEANLDIVIYSGYYYEVLKSLNDEIIAEILEKADYLIDGPFIYKQKSLDLLFRGSKNQRIIDLKKTNITKKIVEKYNFE